MREIKGRAESVSAVFAVFVVVFLGAYSFYQIEQVPAPGSPVALHVDGMVVSGFSVARVQSLQLLGVTLLVQFRISDPAPVSLNLEQLSYSLYGNGNFLGNGSLSKPIKIPADSSSEASSTFAAGYGDTGKLAISYLLSSGRSVSWRAIGTATISGITFGGATKVEFNCTDIRDSVSCTSIASQ